MLNLISQQNLTRNKFQNYCPRRKKGDIFIFDKTYFTLQTNRCHLIGSSTRNDENSFFFLVNYLFSDNLFCVRSENGSFCCQRFRKNDARFNSSAWRSTRNRARAGRDAGKCRRCVETWFTRLHAGESRNTVPSFPLRRERGRNRCIRIMRRLSCARTRPSPENANANRG